MNHSTPRRPGEAIFAMLMMLFSAVCLQQAYKISGFAALSAPGSVPMAATFIMFCAACAVLVRVLRSPAHPTETLRHHILPRHVLLTMVLIVAYALLLKPLGFLPTSVLFVALTIWLLSDRKPLTCLGLAVLSVLAIWIIFRLVFKVMMPEGIVPEREIIAAVTKMLGGK